VHELDAMGWTAGPDSSPVTFFSRGWCVRMSIPIAGVVFVDAQDLSPASTADPGTPPLQKTER
jgi:hypothetical protein